MKLYKDYIKERLNRECVSDEYCFMTYNIYDNDISIIDYFCSKEKRGQGYMLAFCKEQFSKFKKQGYQNIYGYTDTTTNGWERSEELLLKFGFKNIESNQKNYKNYILKLEEYK